MRARQYDPTLGRFYSRDPVAGGSCGDYDYVCADPVNNTDLDGTRPRPRKRKWKVVEDFDLSRDPFWRFYGKPGRVPLRKGDRYRDKRKRKWTGWGLVHIREDHGWGDYQRSMTQRTLSQGRRIVESPSSTRYVLAPDSDSISCGCDGQGWIVVVQNRDFRGIVNSYPMN